MIGSWTHVHTLIRSPTQTNTRALYTHIQVCTLTQAVTPTYACIWTRKKENNRTHKQKQAHYSTHAHKRNSSRSHWRKNIFTNTQDKLGRAVAASRKQKFRTNKKICFCNHQSHTMHKKLCYEKQGLKTLLSKRNFLKK